MFALTWILAAAIWRYLLDVDWTQAVAARLLPVDHPLLLLLALALAPMVPRPRGSLSLGVGIAAVSAVVSRVAIALAP